MRTHRTSLAAVAAAGIAAIAIQFSGIPTSAAGKPTGHPTRPAGETAAQIGSRLVLDALADPSVPAGTSSGPAATPPGGVTIALSSLVLPAEALPSPTVTTVVPVPTIPTTTTTTSTTAPVPVGSAVPTAATVPTPATGTAPAPGVWAELRQCESGGDYTIDTGNGYYGAYQFSAATWQGLGYLGLPNQAAPSVQDQAAERLQARSGWGQWPACSRKLGL